MTDPNGLAAGNSHAINSNPSPNNIRPGYKNSHLGLSNNKNRRCRHPSRQLLKCGGRERPSGDNVVGTSAIGHPCKVAFTIISLANSIPLARKSKANNASRLKPRKPQ